MTSRPAIPLPFAAISRRAADRLRAGHLWVYRSDIERLPADGEAGAGALLSVADSRGIPLGTALYSTHSEIALRLVSHQPGLTRAQYLAELRQRIADAIQLRQQLAPEAFADTGGDNACRLIFSEADDLPGIVADRYHELVVIQLLTQGTAQDDVRAALVEILLQHSWVQLIVERPDPRIRELEKLPPPPQAPLYIHSRDAIRSHDATRNPHSGHDSGHDADPSLEAIFAINGISLHFDAAAGQKTGAFLDQRLNYAAAARYAHGRALDICTYQGGFALHLARTCSTVTGVDSSRTALEVADRNLALNPHLPAKVDWIEADAFELLRDYADSGQRFNSIVLDPPAFAKSKRAAEGAMRGYKELNLRAIKMLAASAEKGSARMVSAGKAAATNNGAKAGGTLVTCSCSHHVALEDFVAVVRSAAEDAGHRVQLLETRPAAPDHPAILTLPETSYLKCLILRVG